jgi:hypothetical protein
VSLIVFEYDSSKSNNQCKVTRRTLLLQSLYYRISADYGRVETAKSLTSTNEDLFCHTVSICAKTNSIAHPNGNGDR